MTKVLFLSRVALLCNACFLVTFLLHFVPAIQNGIITSTIVILGNIVSIVMNVLIHLIYLLLRLIGKSVLAAVPVWILVVNFLFLIFQVILLLK